MGPFVKKATLYTGDVSRVWTQEIIPVEDFFHAVPQYFTPSTADDSFIFFFNYCHRQMSLPCSKHDRIGFSSGDDPQLKTSPAWDRKTKRSNPSQIPTKVSSEVLSFLGGRH